MMNFALILSGGVGTRMRMDGFPKQYLEVEGKPILVYTLQVFEACAAVDSVVIVAAEPWRERIRAWADQYGLNKLLAFAPPGDTRQESILNGLNACMAHSRDEADRVVIHDAVRPCVTGELIGRCLAALDEHDGCMPVLPVTDTVYESRDGRVISRLLERSTIFAGQAPEAFRLRPYARINREAPKEELARCRGTSVIACQHGMDVCLIPGDTDNFKITTPTDLDHFRAAMRYKK